MHKSDCNKTHGKIVFLETRANRTLYYHKKKKKILEIASFPEVQVYAP